MGCDIHFFVEVKEKFDFKKQANNVKDKKETITRPWVSADVWEIDEDELEDSGRKTLHVPYEKEFYSGRNYTLFGVLAGVRDYNQKPIAQPRGLPRDVSAQVKEEAKSWNGDAHSHSYFTLQEILNYPHWNKIVEDYDGKKVKFKDYVGKEFQGTIEKMKKLGKPSEVRMVFWFDN